MAAPKKNQFWKMRSKHGRGKAFALPETLWAEACKYFDWCDANPWMKVEQLKKPYTYTDPKGKQQVVINTEIPTARPYTLTGLCIFLDVNEKYFRDFEDTPTKDFSPVLTRIREIIYTQKYEGAAVGAFNPVIIARDLGLVDKKEVDNKGSVSHKIDYGKLSESALEEIAALGPIEGDR